MHNSESALRARLRPEEAGNLGFLFQGQDRAGVVVLGVFTAVGEFREGPYESTTKRVRVKASSYAQQSRGLGVTRLHVEFQRDPCILPATPDTNDDTRADSRNKSASPAIGLGWWGVRESANGS